jgi:hypothetical protein
LASAIEGNIKLQAAKLPARLSSANRQQRSTVSQVGTLLKPLAQGAAATTVALPRVAASVGL